MNISNLHSLLNDRWFIEKTYGQSLLPSLFSIIKGNDLSIKSGKKQPENFIAVKGATPVAASKEMSSSKDNYVLVLNMKNPIYKYDQECGPQGTKSKMRTLEYYKNDVNCVGIVIDADSGGGQVSGTPEFHDYVASYPKPVVTYTDGMICSAMYYIASASSYIIANKRADYIGSIGTMVSFIDFTGWYEKEGAKVITEYATKSTEKNRPFEELLKGNPDVYIKEVLDPINESFHLDVKSKRPNVSEDVFTGATWDATGALEKKLIDSIGTLQDAIDKVFELSTSSTNDSSINNNSINMKNLPKVEAVLGLTAPLASTDNGSYLQEEQLETIEARLDTLESENSTLQTQVAEAATAQTTAVDAVTNQLTEATASLSAIETSVDATLTEAGLPVEGTLTEKLTAIQNYATVQGVKDGASHTRTKIDANSDAQVEDLSVAGINLKEALNN